MTLLKCIQEGGARERVKKEIIYVKVQFWVQFWPFIEVLPSAIARNKMH